MDAKYPEFSSEPRNVRLSIATDGFNLFRKMSATYSTWPIIVMNYNLPPWLNMKPENLILSIIIHGPNDPGNNIDVYMQPLIEELKELCVLGTLLNIGGKMKDHLAARLDLQDQGIRKALHPMPSADGKHLEFRAEKFDMTNKKKEKFCSVLENAKFPYGFASNISKCVQDRKVTGYKSHDAHVIMQYLLQFAVKGSLKPEVAVPLIRLGEFFRCICSKVIELDEIKRLQEEIIEILCQLENVFTNPFFDIMVHLPVHLCKEIQYDGPVQQRWMHFIERYLGVLKKYVRNRSKPEGSIAEVNESPSVNAEKGGNAIGLGKSNYGKDINLGEDTWIVAHRYILFNYDDKEVEDLIEKHHKLLDSNLENIAKSKWYKTEKTHTDTVCEWFRSEISKKLNVSREVASLAKGPR
ncbi:hypothetical protein AgCh_035067 [Apium graveolens]